jgi:hypothetical protein
MNILEKEVTRWELPHADISNVYQADRDERIQLWWTPVEELKALVLNVFAPWGMVLWNLAEYEAFSRGMTDYMHRLRSVESTVEVLNGLIRDAGAELKSEIASELFGGFTSYFGDKYHPTQRSSTGFLAGYRHYSIAVPETCQPTVSRYFQEQLRVFGDSATKQCPENVTLSYRDESNRTLSALLYKNISTMSENERNAQLVLIRSGVDLLADGKPEHFCFTAGAIGVSALGVEADCEWISDFAEIARFRVGAAIRHYSLPSVQSVKRALDREEWGLLRLADLRDELRGRLTTVLARYPVIETNPFELWKYKEYVI